MPRQIQDDIVQIMREMLIYDERFFSAVEATVALVDAERPSDTEPFVSAIIKGAQQAAALRSPVALMGLVLRLMRVDQALNKQCLDAVLAHIRPDALYKLLSISESIVLASFTYHLFRHHISASQTCYAQALNQARADLRLRIGQSTISSAVLISEMLLDERPDQFVARLRKVSIDDLRRFRPWEIGLIETVYAATYQEVDCRLFVDRDLLSGLGDVDRGPLLAWRRRYLEGDVSNVKCALSTRSSWDREHLGLGKASIERIMADRRNYDTRNAVLLLLDAGFHPSRLSKYPYYVKVLLDETVFARYRFNWSPRIITEVHSQRFAAA